jgi:HSP20 family protein
MEQDAISPSIDVSEDKDTLYIEADIPGFEQKDLNISIKKDRLVLSASKEECLEEKKKNYYRNERFQGSFFREISLPSSVDVAQAKGSYVNSVLKVIIPKKEESKGREIQVNVE